MQLIRVSGKGYLSLGEFELDLLSPGVTAVVGQNRDASAAMSNGAGKSALLESIGWCLFGKCARGCTPTQVVNDGIGVCEVAVEFGDDNGEVWEAVRTRGKQHKFTLTRSGEPVDAGNLALANAALLNAVGISWPVFAASTYLSPASIRAWPALTPTEIKGLFEDALDMRVYTDLHQQARKSVIALRRRESELAGEVGVYRQNLLHLESQVRDLESDDNSPDIEGEVRAFLEAQHLPYGDGNPKKLLKAYEKKLNGLQKEHDDAFSLARLVDLAESEARVAEQNKSRLEAKIDGLRGGDEGVCPTCGQNIRSGTARGRVKAALTAVKRELGAADKALAAAQKKLRRVRKGFSIESFEKNKRNVGRLREAVAFLGRAAQKMEISRVNRKAVVKSKKEEIADLGRKYAKAQEVLGQVTRELDTLNYLVRAYGPGGIPLSIMADITNSLNEYAAYYTSVLTGGEVTIKFDTVTKMRSGKEVERFSVTALNHVGGREYHLFSDGERRRTDLAATLAFRAAISASAGLPSLLVCDEVFSGIDAVGYECIQEVLEKEGRESKIFVVTHDVGLASLFDNTITVVKEGGVARLV